MKDSLCNWDYCLVGGKKMKEQDKYLKIVEWSEKDQCYVGSVPGWIGPCCHGMEEEKVYKELCKIVVEWVAIYKKDKIDKNKILPSVFDCP